MMDVCTTGSCISRCCLGNLKSLPEDIQIGIFQMSESRKRYLKYKLVLSSLMNVSNMSSTAVMKIKGNLQFDDINEYLNLPLAPDDTSLSDMLLLGVINNAEHGQNKQIAQAEEQTLEDRVTESIYKKNRLTSEIFEIIPQNTSKENTLRTMRELPYSLRSVSEFKSHESVSDKVVDDVHKCYEELHNILKLMGNLVGCEMDILHPVDISGCELSQLKERGLLFATRVLLSSLEREFHSPEGAEALRLIGDKQKKEMQKRKSELLCLKDEIAEYEVVIGEGFGGLLEQYLLAEGNLMEMEELQKMFMK